MQDWPRYTTNQVAEAIGVSTETLKSWFKRNSIMHVKGEPEALRHPGTGRTRLFNFKQVIHLGLVAALARVGVEIETASEVAFEFTHKGETTTGPADAVPEPARGPCELYPDDITVLRVLVGNEGELDADVCRLSDLAKSGFHTRGHAWPSFIAIDLNALVYRVRVGLPDKGGPQ